MANDVTVLKNLATKKGREVEKAISSEKLDADKALIRRVAMDIGKEAVSHLRIMYPDAFNAMPKSGHLSLRNCIHNEIMAALEVIDAGEIERRLERRAAHRRQMNKAWKDIRDGASNAAAIRALAKPDDTP
jgi:hypothetical protein